MDKRLNEIFAKRRIQRPIEGVIKADDVTSLGMGLVEYVLTNEAERQFEGPGDACSRYVYTPAPAVVDLRLPFGSVSRTCSRCSPIFLGEPSKVEGHPRPERSLTVSGQKDPDAFLPGLLNKVDRIPRARACCSTSTRRPT